MIVGKGPIALAVDAGRDCSDNFSFVYIFSVLSPSLTERLSQRAVKTQNN